MSVMRAALLVILASAVGGLQPPPSLTTTTVGVWHAGDMGVPLGFEAPPGDPAGEALRLSLIHI